MAIFTLFDIILWHEPMRYIVDVKLVRLEIPKNLHSISKLPTDLEVFLEPRTMRWSSSIYQIEPD